MPEQNQATKRKKEPVKIILVGAPKAVERLIDIFHIRKFLKACNWIEVKRTKDPDELTMTITIRLTV